MLSSGTGACPFPRRALSSRGPGMRIVPRAGIRSRPAVSEHAAGPGRPRREVCRCSMSPQEACGHCVGRCPVSTERPGRNPSTGPLPAKGHTAHRVRRLSPEYHGPGFPGGELPRVTAYRPRTRPAGTLCDGRGSAPVRNCRKVSGSRYRLPPWRPQVPLTYRVSFWPGCRYLAGSRAFQVMISLMDTLNLPAMTYRESPWRTRYPRCFAG